MVKRPLVIFLCAATAAACSHLDVKGIFMPTGDGVEKRFEQSMEMNKDLNAGKILLQPSTLTGTAPGDYMFYVATDPHIDQTSVNLSQFNDAFRNDPEAAFGVILGDCTDVRDNLDKYMEALAYNPEAHAYDHKIYHTLGNHDLFYNGWVDFKEKVGPATYWFEAAFEGGKDLYICLDTATATLGSKQTKWFRSFLAEHRQDYRHCIILTHTNFFYTDNSQAGSGNMPFEESLALIDFLAEQKVTLVLQGHDHYREDLTYDNVRYIILGAIHDGAEAPEYLKVKMTQEGAELEWQVL